MAEKLLKVLNGLLNAAILLTILGAILYSVYSIWDNNSIYAAALQLSVRIREYRPDEEKPSFEDLRRINPDVCAWVTMDGTNIDGPIVQGQTNEEYLNKDVYGDYSLAGTLFLDTRCSVDFTDFDSLVYGHHMDRHEMFGDLDLYLDKDFFDANTTGTLMIPGQSIPLSVLSVMVVGDTDPWVFDPAAADQDPDGFLSYVEENAKYLHADVLEEVQNNPKKVHVLALSTCSTDEEDDRTIVLAAYETPESN